MHSDTPVIDGRRILTTVYVRNNETLVIGGLLTQREMDEDSRIPIQGDIPLVGILLRRENRIRERIELLIYRMMSGVLPAPAIVHG